MGAPDYTVLGDSVNLAARLVARAGPGETLLSEGSTAPFPTAAFAMRSGKPRSRVSSAAVCIWRLPGLRRGRIRGARRVRRPRRRDRAVQGHCCAVPRTACGHVIYVRGEAGIGKTRLVEELRRLRRQRLRHAPRAGSRFRRRQGTGRDSNASVQPARPLADIEPRTARKAMNWSRRMCCGGPAPFLYDVLDLAQTGEWRTLYDAMDNAARLNRRRALIAALARGACAEARLF